MDSEGWIPISLIASFHRVQALTQDVPLIISVSIVNTHHLYSCILKSHVFVKETIAVFQALDLMSIVKLVFLLIAQNPSSYYLLIK